MALWKPNETVGNNEHIGRRLFERSDLAGASDQKRPTNMFPLYHFEEKRDDEVSVDRLGQSSVDSKVKRYLDVRACHAATLFAEKRVFHGWAVAKAKDFRQPSPGRPKLEVVGSAIASTPGRELSDNDYHAHFLRPQELEPYLMACHLRQTFEDKYNFVPAQAFAPSPEPKPADNGLLKKISHWLGSLFHN